MANETNPHNQPDRTPPQHIYIGSPETAEDLIEATRDIEGFAAIPYDLEDPEQQSLAIADLQAVDQRRSHGMFAYLDLPKKPAAQRVQEANEQEKSIVGLISPNNDLSMVWEGVRRRRQERAQKLSS